MSEERLNLNRIRIVLVETSHPGNIGAVARAMKTMGLAHLYLVAPRYFPHHEASARASGAADLLESARVVDDLPSAIDDCGLVLAASARERTIAWPTMEARSAALHAVSKSATTNVAIVLGPERVGLSNRQLDLCHVLVQIPSNPEYSSLNLAAAVQVLCYELRVAAAANCSVRSTDDSDVHVPANSNDVAGFHRHLLQTLVQLEFLDPKNPRQLERRLRRMFNRMQPDTMELNILRGVLAAVQQKIAAQP